ncbi:MAG: hypothetical protein Q4E55_03215 [Bacteroidales bacterium]|nr:hypothetical protein [Bacteroidales bacterium]
MKKEYEKPDMVVYETELVKQLLTFSGDDLEYYDRDTDESENEWF